jgi:hypothetical protein
LPVKIDCIDGNYYKDADRQEQGRQVYTRWVHHIATEEHDSAEKYREPRCNEKKPESVDIHAAHL